MRGGEAAVMLLVCRILNGGCPTIDGVRPPGTCRNICNLPEHGRPWGVGGSHVGQQTGWVFQFDCTGSRGWSELGELSEVESGVREGRGRPGWLLVKGCYLSQVGLCSLLHVLPTCIDALITIPHDCDLVNAIRSRPPGGCS